ncbi:sushi domain-containing protein, scr repeat-containing protein [Cyclospora cayetanensis]|uniref:Sushi domain-containing protein, scr repeat-containing protein n=1 Tax=Cyclospora cayetanensis TaxID=88456 RepID=A0A1D3D8G7_9EIME|nr:sushi domain-containing protein, scr repeat-containing protein [Cyclospora cayetanensis]
MQGDSEEPKQQPGIVELTVEAPLEGGKEYDLIADLGAFTDFSYNPWGPLAPQTVSFVAVATHCSLRVGAAAVAAAAESAEPDGPEAQATAGDEASYELVIAPSGSYAEGDTRAGEGAIAVVRCTEGLAVPSDLVEGADVRNAGMVRCRNGRWDGHLTPCVPRCGPYPSLPEAYEVEEKEEGAAEGLLGASIVIRCTEAAAAGEGEKPQEQTLRCAGGRWEPLKLSCAALCPPLGPSLGHQYSVLLPDGSEPRAAGQGDVEAAAIEGDKRVVSCRDAGVATEQHMEEAEHEQLRQVVQCTEKGWAPPLSFSCNRSCLQPPVPPEGADIQGESLRHGSVWTATCKSGSSMWSAAAATAGVLSHVQVCFFGSRIGVVGMRVCEGVMAAFVLAIELHAVLREQCIHVLPCSLHDGGESPSVLQGPRVYIVSPICGVFAYFLQATKILTACTL